MKTDIENRKFQPSALSLLMVIVAGWICPGLKAVDAPPPSESTAPAALTITDFKVTQPASPVGAVAGGLVGGLIAIEVEKHRERTPYEVELSKKCLAAMEGVFISGRGIVYVPRSSLGITDLNSGSTKGRAIKVELLFGMNMGWKKRLNTMAQWQIVSPDGRVEKKVRTRATADNAAAVFPDTKDPRYEAVFVELAKRNAAQFLEIIRDPSAARATAAAATADETASEAGESIGYFDAITSDPLPQAGQQYYTRNCFKYEKGTFITTNYWVGTLVPINTQVTLVTLDEKNMELRLTGGETVEVKNVEKYSKRSLGTIAHNLLTPQPVPLEKLDPATASAIKSGTLMAGMNKEQVVMTRGYPPGHRTPSLDGETWMYWNTRSGTQSIVFEHGILSEGMGILPAVNKPKPEVAVPAAESKPTAATSSSPATTTSSAAIEPSPAPPPAQEAPNPMIAGGNRQERPAGSPAAGPVAEPTRKVERAAPRFALHDAVLKPDSNDDCETDGVIVGVQGNTFTFRPKTMSFRNSRIVVWGYGARHQWEGKLTFKGYTFDSSAEDPLVFQLVRNGGYQYVKGKGTVTFPNGKSVHLPETNQGDATPVLATTAVQPAAPTAANGNPPPAAADTNPAQPSSSIGLKDALNKGLIKLTIAGDKAAEGTPTEGSFLLLSITNTSRSSIQISIPKGVSEFPKGQNSTVSFEQNEEQLYNIAPDQAKDAKVPQRGFERIVSGEVTYEKTAGGGFQTNFKDLRSTFGERKDDKPSTPSGVGTPQQEESKATMVVPEEAIRLNTEAKQYHDSGQFDKVIELLTKAVQLAPQYAEAYNNLAVAHAAKGQEDTALSFATKAIAIAPDKGAYQTTAGLAYYKLGNLDKAIDAFTKAIALGETAAEMRSVLGNAYFKKGMLDEAIEQYQKALALNPDLRGARNNLKAAEEEKQGKR